MRSKERIHALMKSPILIWDILVRKQYGFLYDRMPITIYGMSKAKQLNLIKSGANLIYRRLKPWSMPLHMQIELTNYCNLRCPLCPSGTYKLERKPHAMNLEIFSDLIDEVGPYLLTVSLWGWGEPLLHPKLYDILQRVKKYNIAVLLSTNGQNLNTDKVIDALTKAPPTHLIIAVDGLTEETNSKFRVGSRLSPILDGVGKIAEIKKSRGLQLPILHMRYIVMKHNQHELPQLMDFAKRNHFDFLTIRTLAINASDSCTRMHQKLIPDISDFRAYDYKNSRRVLRNDFICQEPFWFPSVFSDGTLVACEQDYNAQHPLGVISKDKSFTDAWRGNHAIHVRKMIRDNPNTTGYCTSCPYRDRYSTDISAHGFFLN